MQLPFFYEEHLPDSPKNFTLSPETSKHVVQVLRRKKGDSIVLTDGKGCELTVKLVNPDKKAAEVEFVSNVNHLAPDRDIAIGISLLKNESRFEWFVEKATELGVNKIIPLLCSRSERKTLKKERIQNILISGMLQSRQLYLPELTEPTNFEDVLTVKDYSQKLIAHCLEDNDKADLREISEKDATKIILIGPEGDFTKEELDSGLKAGFLPVTLGSTRLRTETAGIVAAVLLEN